MKKDKIITALDIGSSKVCCLIGLVQKDSIIDVLGYGICYHNCLNKGVVVDIKGLSDAIGMAVYEAEEMSGRKIQSVFFNISGNHIKGIHSHGEVMISDKDNEITKHDLDRVIASAESVHMPYERDIVYSIRKSFTVDDEKGIVDPVGMFGIKLETDMYLITAKISLVDNIKKAVRQAGLGIDDYILTPLATSYSVISSNEKELGAILVDIGADLTEIAIFLERRISFLSVIPMGANDITKTVAVKLHIPEPYAEEIKLEHGSVDDAIKAADITVKMDSQKKTISRLGLKEALAQGYTDIFKAVKKELSSCDFAQDASSGIIMCGQSAMMDGCLELAEMILNFPVKMGYIMGIGRTPKSLPGHIYATSAGLLKYGCEKKVMKKSLLAMGPRNMVITMVNRLQTLYNEYF